MKQLKTAILCFLLALTGCTKTEALKETPAVTTPGKYTATTKGIGALGDPNIKYFGRWDLADPAQYFSHWGGAYLKVKFTGTTVKVKFGNTSNYYARIDNGPWVSYTNVTGTVNLTPSPLASGTHSLSIAQGKDYAYVFSFQGLTLDAGASTAAPDVFPSLIEYIGDSITSGYTCAQANVSDYAWVCSELLGTEHTQIAFPGIALVNNYGLNTNKTGMETQYLKLQNLSFPASPNWDFSKYTPKVIVVNLGQNDNGTGVPDDLFQSTYTNFLATIRSKFPVAEIFALRPFTGVKATPTQAAVNARIAAGDARVHYVNTTGWITQGTADYNDGAHPSVSGHIKVANLLKPILAPYVASPALANGTYKLVNRTSGLALDVKGNLTADQTPIQQWGYTGGNNQRWTVTNIGNGQYRILSVQSGKSLDVAGNATADGTRIQLYTSTNANNQRWVITPGTVGYYFVKSVSANKMMEVPGHSTAPGALIQVWTNTGSNSQQWAFQAP
ncbi:RICIN domain-containing protein [Hufsiella ginkgonis]|uniref:Ricin B lectin domain-containing protein n=1 Tax=Hufsiella ginkgonis TaxID=2695274 RepID=A0A7K1Y1Y3_9SPHI|nr:RICIN domain-containing protein [Hufsiella ginkgonis]MXV17231.1 hypothetical protein [Hufsiella ginkgonis]